MTHAEPGIHGTGTVYLLHLDRPYKHARHYVGWTEEDLARRLEQHRAGQGSPLLRAAGAVGIGFKVARLWENHTRLKERRLKRSGGATRYCPLCRCEQRVAVANEGACQ